MRDRAMRWWVTGEFVGGVRVGLAMRAWAVMLGALLSVAGCGSPIRSAARAGTLLASTHVAAGEQIDAARDRALDAVEAAHPEPGPARNAALDAEAANWQPVGLALDAMREALRSYAQSVTLAHAAGEGDALLPEIARLLARLVALYDAIERAAEEAGLEEIPRLPAEVRDLARAMGGA